MMFWLEGRIPDFQTRLSLQHWPSVLDIEEAGFLPKSVLLLALLNGYFVNRLLYPLLCDDIGPLDPSSGVPEESGVRRSFLTHYSMKFATHSLPAPRSLLLEAE